MMNDKDIKLALDTAVEKFKPLIDKIGNHLNLDIGFEITWTWKPKNDKTKEN